MGDEGRDRHAVLAELATSVLGGPLADPDLARLDRRCGGDPALARELLLAGNETGVVRWAEERFRVDGALPTHRLSPLLGRLHEQYVVDGSDLLDLLAWGEPLPEQVAARLLDDTVLRALSRDGWVRVAESSDDRRLVLYPPVLAEALRAATLPERRRSVLARLAAAFDEAGMTEHEPVRVARWWLEIGGGSAALLDRAARDAYAAGSYADALALAEGALARGAGYTAALARGAALGELGRVDEALEVLRGARELAGCPLEIAWAQIAEAHVLGVNAARWAEADAMLAQAGDVIGDPEARADLHAERALLAALSGRAGAALGLARQVLVGADSTERSRLIAATAAGSAAALRLEAPPVEVEQVATNALPAETVRALPLGPDLIAANRMLVEGRTGAVPAQVVAAVSDRRRAAFDAGAAEQAALWSAVLGQLRLQRGELAPARMALRDALHLLTEYDSVRLTPVVAADLALAAVQAGDPFAAEQALEQVGVDREATPRVASRSALVEAWLLALRDGPVAATQAAVVAGDRAAEQDHLAGALEAWHLPVRLGHPEPVVDRLASLGEALRPSTAGIGASAIVAHAPAALDGSAESLAELARAFAAGGRFLLAAETAAQAAVRAQGIPLQALMSTVGSPLSDGVTVTGEDVGPARFAALAGTLRRRCPGADTPAVRHVQAAPLTGRELEVARLAREGVSNRRIAARLDLSPRTVENHLASVYRKCGLRGRADLALVVDDGADGGLLRAG